jgi:hypothetical protein
MTLKTFRGQGVYQPAIDEAIRKLDLGDWVSPLAALVWTIL